jgi:hypothetical protein
MTAVSRPLIHVAPAGHGGVHAVRIGMPMPRAWVEDKDEIAAFAVGNTTQQASQIPIQSRVLARWPDRSIKWLLIDFVLNSSDSQAGATIELRRESPAVWPVMAVEQHEGTCRIDTGAATFRFRSGGDKLIDAIQLKSNGELLSDGLRLVFADSEGRRLKPQVSELKLENSGPVCTVLRLSGTFEGDCPVEFTARCWLAAGSSTAAIDLRLRNPRAAIHRGGLWDLGDPGSFLIGEASLVMKPAALCESLLWQLAPSESVQTIACGENWSIHQESSGGENWDSPNHVDADGRLVPAFRGYAISGDGARAEGPSRWRAQPALAVIGAGVAMAASVRDFWQNFPKSLTWAAGELRIGVFPASSGRAVELQGGEQKRHRISLAFGDDAKVLGAAQAALDPPYAWVDPAWIEASGAVRGMVTDLSASPAWTEHVRTVVDGPNSFTDRREIIDEYGWRNFGDLYADHEAVNHTGPEPFITHYNNQYDFVWAAGFHALRTGDPRWARLARECAEHTADIDIYHTSEDRPAFSGGLFWHTDHYLPAKTSSHRTYSASNATGAGYGGGPANEHNYASGLLLHYWRTGDEDAKEAVLGLADWVIAMDNGALTILGLTDSGATGFASRSVDPWYHGPGRGAGNSIATLLDAYSVARHRGYLDKAEALVRRCIHPAEDIFQRGLDDIENRWSYLAFLQSLGRYIELKFELGEIDFMFHYARESLLHYADWMLEHEVPYKDVLHRVELPTESWPAHDMRKCHIFHLAARFDDRGRERIYAQRAACFHYRSLADLNTFATRHLTRPLVLLAVYGHLHAYYSRLAPIAAEVRLAWRHDHDFGSPQVFVGQKDRLKPLLRDRISTLRREASRIVRDKLPAKSSKRKSGAGQ